MRGKFQFLASLAVMLLTSICANAQYTDANGVTYTAVGGSKGYGNEGNTQACDGRTDTKFGNTMGTNQYVVIRASKLVKITGYTIITANDNAQWTGRNPKSWTVEGSNDQVNWTVIDQVTDDQVMQDVNYTPFDFTCAESEYFQYFKLNITAAQGGSGAYLQFSEFHVNGTPLPTLGVTNGFNADVVVEALPVDEHLTLGIDNPTTGFYTQSVSKIVEVDDVRTYGMPKSQPVVSATSGAIYDIDYAGEQTLQLSNARGTEATLTLKNHVKVPQIYLLCNSSDGGTDFDVVVNYIDGTSSDVQSFNAPDWYNTGDHSGDAVFGMQRVKRDATQTNGGIEAPLAIRFVDRIVTCDPAKTVESLKITYKGSSTAKSIINIIGVSTGDAALTVFGNNADVIAESFPFGDCTSYSLDTNDYVVYVDGVVVGKKNETQFDNYNHGLPVNGTLVSKAGTTFVMDYANLNALRLGDVNEGTLEVEAVKAGKVRLLTTCGNGATDIKVTPNYTDGTTGNPVVITIPDWFKATTSNVAVEKLGRVYNSEFDDCENFYLFEDAVTVNPNKTVASLKIEKVSNANGVPVIMGLAYDAPLAPQTEVADASATTLLPAKKYGDDYEAYVWSVKGDRYDGAKYNVIVGTPEEGDAGEKWYENDYYMPGNWAVKAAPFSGWTDNEIMGDVYVRRYFTVNGTLPTTLYMPTPHDDAPAEYYINGTRVWAVTDGWNEDEIVRLTPEQIALIKTDGSVNVFAYHVHQNWGGYFADGGVYAQGSNPANAFEKDIRVLEQTIAIAETECAGNADYAAAIENSKGVNVRSQIGTNLGNLRGARRVAMGGNHADIYAGTEPADGLTAYLYNVGTGLFLCGGNDWGTHASVAYAARPVTLHANTSGENRYAIQTELPNGVRGRNDGLGHNGYVDCGYGDDFTTAEGWAWTFEPAGNGMYRIINCQNGGDNIYLGVSAGEGLQVDTDKAGADNVNNLWKLVTKKERMRDAINATASSPKDLTFLIHQSTFSQNDFDGNDKGGANADLNDSAWERNAGSIWNWKGNDAAGDYVFEMWNTNDSGEKYIYQTLKGLGKGTYRVSVTGYYRDGSYDNAVAVANDPVKCAYLVANNEEALLPAITEYANTVPGYGRESNGLTFPDGARDAAKYFQVGSYRQSVIVEVGADHTLKIGARKNRTTPVVGDDWMVVDNFRLECLDFNDLYIESDYQAGTESKVTLSIFGVPTAFVDRYSNKKITVTDLNGNEVAKIVKIEDNYQLSDYSCSELYFTLDRALANGEYLVNIPTEILVMGSGADVDYNHDSYQVALSVFGAASSVGDETGINTVNVNANGKTYNVQGIEVKNAQRGLYIQNGKKVVK